MKKGSTRRGAPFFARSPARGDFAARKGCFCPCTVQGASQRGHSLSQKRMAPLEPQEKGLDWQSRARMTFVPPEWKCLRGGIALLAANGSARRFASAPIIRCCVAVGGSAALRMRHTPCGCRSAHLVEVRSNSHLPPVSTMRRAPAMPHSAGSLPPDCRHSRLTIVRRGCKRSRLAGIHGEAMYTAPSLRSACSPSSCKPAMAGSRGRAPCVLLGVQGGHSLT